MLDEMTPTRTAARDLAEVGAAARRWMAGPPLEYLAPAHTGLPVTPRTKACLELGLLRMLLTRWCPGDPVLPPLAARVREIWADPAFAEQTAAKPEYAHSYGLVYGALAPPDATTEHHRRHLEKMAPGGVLAEYGRRPETRMEVHYFADLAGLRHTYPPYGEQYWEAAVASLREPELPFDIHEAYVITHTVFHITDFGAVASPLPAEENARLLGICDRLTAHFVDTDYWDLAAEFLITRICLGEDPTRTASGAAAVAMLVEAQTAEGAIPGRWAAQRPPADAPPVELFRKSFHTTLVTALAGTLSELRHGRG